MRFADKEHVMIEIEFAERKTKSEISWDYFPFTGIHRSEIVKNNILFKGELQTYNLQYRLIVTTYNYVTKKELLYLYDIVPGDELEIATKLMTNLINNQL